MAVEHSGQIQNQLLMEEHDGQLNAKRVVSAATIFAVVNTASAGQSSVVIDGNVTVQQGTTPWVSSLQGNVTLSDSKAFIGLTTTTLGGSPAFVGIVTVTNKDRTITGNVTLSDSKTFIGLTTTTLGASPAFIGIATTINAASPAFIGIVTIANSNVRSIAGNVTLSDAKTFIGLVTSVNGAGDKFIGLVTAVTRNAGTNKTLKNLPIVLSTASIQTVVTPSNTFYITSLLINSNATVRVNVKSGATYLTGNATLGINLNPGGGWVETGSPDAPIYIGLAGAAAITIEKFDYSGVISQIGGKVVYFDE